MKHKYKKGFLQWMFNHIREMQDNMILLENNLDKLPFKLKSYDLIRRCIYHDLDKFKKDKIDAYYNFYYYCVINDMESPDSVEKIRKKHYSTNRHHPDFHLKTGKPFTNIDLCELCCDMLERTYCNYGDYTKQFSYCEEKFFIKHPEMLKYKSRMYYIFNLLIELKNETSNNE